MEKKLWLWGFVVIVVAFCAATAGSGCAYGRIAAPTGSALETNCGEFEYGTAGIPPFYTPAGQYSSYRAACAQGEFARIIAEQRSAVVRASWTVAEKANAVDPVAREGVRRALRGSQKTRRAFADHLAAEGGAQ